LTAGKAYHFRVQSKDAAGNAALSTDYTFTTATAASTAGNTYYVATTGYDGYPGTETQPFRTLSHGVSVLTPGDTLYVMSGTYAESLPDNIPAGTSWSAPVTVAAAPGHTVTLKPNPGAKFVLHFQGAQQYIVIDGLILDGTNVTYDTVKITTGGAGTAHHIRLQNSEIRNTTWNSGSYKQGILVTEGADWNELINLNVHHNGLDWHDHGIYIESSHNLVEKSIIHHNTGYGVHLYTSGSGGTNNNTVRDNLVHNNGTAGSTYTFGIILSSGSENTAYNNVVWDNEGGIQVENGSPVNTTVYNNTIYHNASSGMYVGSDSSNAIIQNNLLYANGTPEIHNSGEGTVLDHNLMGTDPKFVNATSGDFRLQSNSPAIDAGIAVSSVTTDIAGTLRPQGGGDDIGAFEVTP